MKNLRMVGFRLGSLLLLAAQFSCGGGGDSTVVPSVATTLTANTSPSLIGTAGSVVATPPSVMVRDQKGDAMSGVPVGFNVGSGGGSITGAAAVTNSSGVATVGSWTLGATVGTNTLVASTGSLTPVTFTAITTAGAAAAITKSAGDAQTAPAGSALPIAPSVIVKDANGNPVSGASVTFAVTGGGGSVTGAVQTANSSGVATVGGWTLGASAGANSLSASTGSLTPAVFTATGTVGPAAVVVKTAGDNQSAEDGTAVAIPPAVTVRDASGNPVAGVSVTFAPATGGGSVTGGSQTTNASGVATVGSWTLGTVGSNTLTATAGTLPPVTFTATATFRAACRTATAHTFGTTTAGTLATTDCRLSDGAYIDYFTTSISTAGAYVITDSSTVIDPFLLFYGPDGWIIGINDDGDQTSMLLHSRIKALIPGATSSYILGATSLNAGEVGDYKISSAPTSSAITNCEEVFAARGITTNQNLETTDCVFSQFYSDDTWIFLRAGQTVTISMNSTAFDASLELWRGGSTKVAENDNRTTGTTDAQIVYPVLADDFYLIVPTSHVTLTTGAYTLIIQ
jgi:hypothetical protein